MNPFKTVDSLLTLVMTCMLWILFIEFLGMRTRTMFTGNEDRTRYWRPRWLALIAFSITWGLLVIEIGLWFSRRL